MASLAEFEPITGRYLGVDIQGERHRIYLDEAGRGIPCFACTRRETTVASSAT